MSDPFRTSIVDSRWDSMSKEEKDAHIERINFLDDNNLLIQISRRFGRRRSTGVVHYSDFDFDDVPWTDD